MKLLNDWRRSMTMDRMHVEGGDDRVHQDAQTTA